MTGDSSAIDPVAIVVDTAGSVYVSDQGNNITQKFDGSGKFITEWGC
jgi:DNA-binding beta-propeller fold protein YncE